MMIILIFSFKAMATNELGIKFGLNELDSQDEKLKGGVLILKSNELTPYNLYEELFVRDSFAKNGDYGFNILDVLFYNKADSFSKDSYMGWGIKRIFLDNSTASDFWFTTDITGYLLPISLRIGKEINDNLELVLVGDYFAIGKYEMLVPGDNGEGNIDGYSASFEINFRLSESFKLNATYILENYNFDKDDDIIGYSDFSEGYHGIYLGAQMVW